MNIYFNNFVNNLHEENQLLKRYPHLCFEFIIHVRKLMISKIFTQKSQISVTNSFPSRLTRAHFIYSKCQFPSCDNAPLIRTKSESVSLDYFLRVIIPLQLNALSSIPIYRRSVWFHRLYT